MLSKFRAATRGRGYQIAAGALATSGIVLGGAYWYVLIYICIYRYMHTYFTYTIYV